MFNHYVFETVAALLRTVCSSNPAPDVVDRFEGLLFPPFLVRAPALLLLAHCVVTVNARRSSFNEK